MLLTNQKTINYENLYKIKGNHSFSFDGANINQLFELFLIKN